MKTKAAALIARALADEGAPFTFGIPGTHNIELYDALRGGPTLPVLVTDEQGASFIADGVSRSSDKIGVVNVVPGAGLTHALSGIAEAWLDGIPMVVLCCGIRRDTGRAYQLHAVDQLGILAPVTKARYRPETLAEVYPAVRRAFREARSGCPGPVAVEIPAELYILTGEAPEPFWDEPAPGVPAPDENRLREAARLLNEAERPALYFGNGCGAVPEAVRAVAEKLGAPVATTLQGKGVFPEDHPLWVWNGFGRMAPPFAKKIFDRADCLLAVGCRFGEVATGSYGIETPPALIHADIDPSVFGKNYAAKVAIHSDAGAFLDKLLPLLKERPRDEKLVRAIAEGHAAVDAERRARPENGKVSQRAFFSGLMKAAGPDGIYTADSGNGTFAAMEYLRLSSPRRFLAPVDYSCMGYAVPAAIGAKLASPKRRVAAIEGDGAMLMTGLELATAVRYGAGVVAAVLRDRELSQIAQFQQTALGRKTATEIHPYDLEALARAVGCGYRRLDSSEEAEGVLAAAFDEADRGVPVIVETEIDYSETTYFTRGVVSANFRRLPLGEKVRMAGRVISRKIRG